MSARPRPRPERDQAASYEPDLNYVPLFEIPDGPPPPKIVGPFGAADGLTVFLGDGGAGKSLLVETLTLSVATGQELIAGMPATLTGAVLWLDFEGRRRATRNRAGRLVRGPAPIYYVPCDRPIWDEIDRIRRIVQKVGAVLIVVDSVGYAVGGEYSAKDDEAARLFTMAIRDIGLPAFAIAHVPKNGRVADKPFGSAYWHNGATETWAVEKVGRAGHVARLTNHKNNDGDLGPPVTLEVLWAERIVLRPRQVRPPDEEIVATVNEVGPVSTAGLATSLANAGWDAPTGWLADRLSWLVAASRIGRSGKTKDTLWSPVGSAGSNEPPNASSSCGDGPTNEPPKEGVDPGSGADGGAE